MNREIKALLLVVILSMFVVLTLVRGFDSDEVGSSEPGIALTENDFAGDPSLFAVPEEGVVVTFLEHPNSTDEQIDTGVIGMDVIPFKYTDAVSQTFCWEDDNLGAEHFMTLVDMDGAEVLRVVANGVCVTEIIPEGDYEMHIQHDDKIEETFAMFAIPEEGDPEKSLQTHLTTNKCLGCDLSGADFSGAVLTNVILSGSDLSGAILANADLSGADLSYSLLVSAAYQLPVLGLKTTRSQN